MNERKEALVPQSSQIQFCIPEIILNALDVFIQDGDGWDMELDPTIRSVYEDMPMLDIPRSTLIKFCITSYGNKKSDVASKIVQKIKKDSLPQMYITIRSSHPQILQNPEKRMEKLICAMVYIGIPIYPYFDGKKINF